MKRHLLSMSDLSAGDIIDILNLAEQLKFERKNGIEHKLLTGKTLGMIFQKSSTRTRVSFEAGMYQMGGQALFLSSRDLQIGRGEPVEDTARVLSRYLDGIMIRTYSHKEVEDFAAHGTIPVINGLTDYAHPCQVLADLMTVREYKGGLEGLKAAYIGDGNNMANSIIIGGLTAGMRISAACPRGYGPDKKVLDFAAGYGDKFMLTEDPFDAAENADVLCTDVWSSMGMEEEAEIRRVVFARYCIDEKLMEAARPGAMVLHCLPAHRGEEITADVFEAHADEIFEEAENRLHVQKAVLVKLMS